VDTEKTRGVPGSTRPNVAGGSETRPYCALLGRYRGKRGAASDAPTAGLACVEFAENGGANIILRRVGRLRIRKQKRSVRQVYVNSVGVKRFRGELGLVLSR